MTWLITCKPVKYKSGFLVSQFPTLCTLIKTEIWFISKLKRSKNNLWRKNNKPILQGDWFTAFYFIEFYLNIYALLKNVSTAFCNLADIYTFFLLFFLNFFKPQCHLPELWTEQHLEASSAVASHMSSNFAQLRFWHQLIVYPTVFCKTAWLT